MTLIRMIKDMWSDTDEHLAFMLGVDIGEVRKLKSAVKGIRNKSLRKLIYFAVLFAADSNQIGYSYTNYLNWIAIRRVVRYFGMPRRTSYDYLKTLKFFQAFRPKKMRRK